MSDENFKDFWKNNYNSADFMSNFEKAQDVEFSKPYDSLSELPPAVKKLPTKAQQIFRGAFNSAYKNPPKGQEAEKYAFAVAWSAVKKAGFKKDVELEDENIANLLKAQKMVEMARDVFKDLGLLKEKSLAKEKFSFMIEKAYTVDEQDNLIPVSENRFNKNADSGDIDLNKMYIEGIASTTNVDHDHERMSKDAMAAMMEDINERGVPLMSEHQKTWDGKLGEVVKGWMDERGQLHIKAKLDKDSSRATDLYKALKKGLQVGLSVAGIVKRSAQEYVESLGKKVKTFYDVDLKEISVTNRPSNFDTWLVAKNRAGSLEGHLFGQTHPSYEEYLQDYPSLNWQLSFAKSVAEVSKDIMPEEVKNDGEVKADEVKTEEQPKVEVQAPAPEVKAPEVAAPEVKTEEVKTEEVKTEGDAGVDKAQGKKKPVTESSTDDSSTETAKAQMNKLAKAVDAIELLAKNIEELLKQSKSKAKVDEETSDTSTKKKAMKDDSTDVDSEDSETGEDKKKPAKKAMGDSDTVEETNTESEANGGKKKAKKAMDDSSDSGTEMEPKKKPTKKDAVDEPEADEEVEEEVDAAKAQEEALMNSAVVAKLTSELEKRFAAQGKRILGPLQETVEKMMNTVQKRKGVASETAYVLEKNFTGNPDKKVEKKEEVVDIMQKDAKDENVSFKDYFKKHLSSFEEKEEEQE